MPRKKKAAKMGEFDLTLITEERAGEIKAEINALEKMLKDDQSSKYPKIQDIPLFKQEIKNKQKILDDHGARKLKGQKANKAYAVAKELRKKIQSAMPTTQAYYQRYPKSGDSFKKEQEFEKAVQQQIAFQTNPELKAAVRQYKNIMARLDPSDPTLRNIESLRR